MVLYVRDVGMCQAARLYNYNTNPNKKLIPTPQTTPNKTKSTTPCNHTPKQPPAILIYKKYILAYSIITFVCIHI